MIPHLLVAELTRKDGNMFCGQCGAELPEGAKFCMKCGEPQRDVTLKSKNGQGHWEYKEFSETLGNLKFKDSSTGNITGGIGDERLISPIEEAVKRILDKHSPEGWEPYESIIADDLWRVGHVTHQIKKRDSWLKAFQPSSIETEITLVSVRLVCRRWTNSNVQDDASKKKCQDYNRQLVNILLEMAGKPKFQDKRKIFRQHTQMCREPAFFPSFLQLISFMGQKDDHAAAVANSVAAAVTLELREFLESLDASGLSAGDVAANLVIAPMADGLETEDKTDDAEITLDLVKSIISLYPRIKEIPDNLKNHFAEMIKETELRTDIRDAKVSQEMKEQSVSLRKTSLFVEQIIAFMGVMESDGTDQQAVNKAAAMDAETLMGISAMLVQAFEVMNQIEEKNKVAFAFLNIISAQKKREK